jgi:hypothetical protein
MRMKHARLLGLGLALTLVGCSARPAPSSPHPMLGKAISLDLPTDKGKLVSMPWRGPRAYVLDFWAPTCKPCREKLPELVGRKRDLEARGAALVLVAILEPSESTDEARRVLASWGVDEPFLVSDSEAARSRAGVPGLPSTMVLDEHGTLRWVAPQQATASDVVGALP